MAPLETHLEQISICATSIAELSFPQPKIFTNALVQPHHITTLIRDTEAHERVLFSVPAPQPSKIQSRRTTTFQRNGGNLQSGETTSIRAPKRNTAVAAVLGGDLVERIRRGGGGLIGTGNRGLEGKDKSEVDVEVLLEGAEKLCAVYPIPGASEKIASLRQRHQRLATSISHYEQRVTEQAALLNRLNRPRDFDDSIHEDTFVSQQAPLEDLQFTEEDMRREEDEVKELERRRRTLEERVSAMEKDISGVMG